jgi:uncharacterized SAM-binding protein YcdF (DUF218 family)
MPYEVHILLRTLYLPPASPLLIGLAALVVWRRRPRLAMALCTICIVTLWVLSTPIVADALARTTEGYPALDPARLSANQARAQAIVILGGGVRRNAPEAGGDTPSAETDLRLIEGARVARATHLPILTSGSRDEAPAMRRFMEEDLQLPVRWVESESRNTHDNAVLSAAILGKEGIRRIILVTSGSHMTRAAAEFAAAGLEITAAPSDMVGGDERGALAFALSLAPSIGALGRSTSAIYELTGRLVRLGS